MRYGQFKANQSTATKLLRGLDRLVSPLEGFQQAGMQWLGESQPSTNIPLIVQLIGKLKTTNAKNHLSQQSPDTARKNFARSMQLLRCGFAVEAQRDIRIKLGTHQLAALHYQPFASQHIPALLLYFHGGGFVVGDLDTHDDICRFLCQQTGLQVLSVAYRLAPEHPFPAGLNDAMYALRWVKQHAQDFAVNPDHIVVAGDSAGANFAAILSQREECRILASLLIYPSTDRSRSWPSSLEFANSAFLSKSDRNWFYQHYLGNQAYLSGHSDVSPLLGLEQLLDTANHPANAYATGKRICPAIVVTGGHDALQDEGSAYVTCLKKLQVPVTHLHFDRLDHGFMHFIGINRTSYLAAKQITTALRQLCLQ